MIRFVALLFFLLFFALSSLPSCASREGERARESVAEIEACPSRPSCFKEQIDLGGVASQSATHELIHCLEQVVREMERVQVTKVTDEYFHAEFRSRVFGFVDDFEALVFENTLYLRSISRTGYYDFNVNQERVLSIVHALRAECLR